MTTRKATKPFVRGVGNQTKKRTGYVVTSLRLLAQENRELRRAAKREGISFNGWAINTLLTAARKGTSANGETDNS
jgi:hypothetical protein